MKKLIALLAVVMFSVGSIMARDRITSDVNELPAQAKTLVIKYYPKVGVNHIKIDKDLMSTDYDVVLNDGTELDFDGDGNLKEIDCGFRAVPDGLILKPIREYVASNFKGQKIVSMEVNRSNYEIQLANGLELKFDRAGKFVRVDD